MAAPLVFPARGVPCLRNLRRDVKTHTVGFENCATIGALNGSRRAIVDSAFRWDLDVATARVTAWFRKPRPIGQNHPFAGMNKFGLDILVPVRPNVVSGIAPFRGIASDVLSEPLLGLRQRHREQFRRKFGITRLTRVAARLRLRAGVRALRAGVALRLRAGVWCHALDNAVLDLPGHSAVGTCFLRRFFRRSRARG